jgi:hypothetical protein
MSSKKTEKSRSEMIRDHVSSASSEAEKSPSAIIEALKAKGISVTKQLVYQVKADMKKKRRRVAGKTAVAARNNNKSFDASSWLFAKNLLHSVGGDLKAAKENLEIVSKILNS